MTKRIGTVEDAVDAALRILRERFGEPDQQATVQLGLALYSLQERERFEARDTGDEIPYRT